MRQIHRLTLVVVLSVTLGGIAPLVQAAAGPDGTAIYREGRDAIDSQDWARAERCFREYLRQPRAPRGDAALFYLAFALKKQVRFAEARGSLTQLLKEYPSSGWVEDAATMEAEMIAATGPRSSLQEAAIQERQTQAARVLVDNLAMEKDRQSFALLRELAVGGNGELASAALRALKLYPEANQPAFFGQLVEEGKSTEGRRTALWTLMEMRTPEAGAELLRLFHYLPDRSLRKLIVAYLAWAAMDQWPQARDLLTEIRDTTSGEDFRQAARHYLAEAQTPEALDALLSWYALETDDEIKLTLIPMLGRMYGDQPAVMTKLQEIADGTNPQLAKQARGVLSGGGYGTTFPFLQRRSAKAKQKDTVC